MFDPRDEKSEQDVFRDRCRGYKADLEQQRAKLTEAFHSVNYLLLARIDDPRAENLLIVLAAAVTVVLGVYPQEDVWKGAHPEFEAMVGPALRLRDPVVAGEWRKRGYRTCLRQILVATMYLGAIVSQLLHIANGKREIMHAQESNWILRLFRLIPE
jgi:hypothetical protein